MSARSAQRTRWRRWRMGWDIAGRKDRDGRHEWTQVVGSAQTSAPWPSRFFVLATAQIERLISANEWGVTTEF